MQKRQKRTLEELLEINQRSIEKTREKLKRQQERSAKLLKEKKERDERVYTLRVGTLVKELVGGDVDEQKLKAFLYEKLLGDQNSDDGLDGAFLEDLDEAQSEAEVS